MKLPIKKIIVAVLLLSSQFVVAGACEECEKHIWTCATATGSAGTCKWTGSWGCFSNYGSCPTNQMAPTVKDANCVSSDPSKNCEIDPVEQQGIGNKCKAACKVVPFISCNCLGTGVNDPNTAHTEKYKVCKKP